MARIQTYTVDTILNSGDMIIGTDGAQGANNATKNFTVGTLKEFINTGIPDPTDSTDVVSQGYIADNVVNGGSISGGTLTLTRTGELDDVAIDGLFSGSYNDLTDKPIIPTAYTDADVDAHLNKNAQTQDGLVLSLSNNDYAWVAQSSGSGYTDTDVDTHLNISTATTNQVLAWSGTDYDWVDQSGGIAGTRESTQTTAITEIKTLTQVEYDALVTKEAAVMYVIL